MFRAYVVRNTSVSVVLISSCSSARNDTSSSSRLSSLTSALCALSCSLDPSADPLEPPPPKALNTDASLPPLLPVLLPADRLLPERTDASCRSSPPGFSALSFLPPDSPPPDPDVAALTPDKPLYPLWFDRSELDLSNCGRRDEEGFPPARGPKGEPDPELPPPTRSSAMVPFKRALSALAIPSSFASRSVSSVLALIVERKSTTSDSSAASKGSIRPAASIAFSCPASAAILYSPAASRKSRLTPSPFSYSDARLWAASALPLSDALRKCLAASSCCSLIMHTNPRLFRAWSCPCDAARAYSSLALTRSGPAL
mmetsp:Transcript_4539/g.20686  ORF Transcript_4539/g.20686 Transcript_4539/m.20686 type:complete len:314 (-) Transcript_4539:964-1905(-)